jgi:Domain of unknown function (DUF5916)
MGLLARAALVSLPFICLSASAEEAVIPLSAARTSASIVVDGDLGDEGWKDVPAIDTWYETNPGDNVPPKVRSVGYLACDDKSFYAGFRFEDPKPRAIRAPLSDRDNVPPSTDYAGVILDTRHDRRTGILFLANPRGIQYDAVQDDASNNEDSAPDFFWESKGKVTAEGWTLEIRIPFSSLRYPKRDVQTWGIMLYRNYPREFRYQIFSTRLPRGGSCFICFENELPGLRDLPSGGHLVLAPYASGSRRDEPEGELGTPLQNGSLDGDLGLDVKWTPFASAAVDATINPDFSQIESDVAQIGANERFALFFPEKRPFFLEGVELLRTPVQAVYTRTVTSPRFGLRGTGKAGACSYTALAADDRGGGSVIIPGPNGSELADQDFRSFVAIGRLRRDFGKSFVSLLATDREIDGPGYNRVVGPDFQWRHGDGDTVTGQYLMSWSRTPDRPDLATEWDGRRLDGHGADVWWYHARRHADWTLEYKDFGDGFRADNGFVPQVGYRQEYAEAGWTAYPTKGAVRRLRSYFIFDHSADREGDLLNREYSPGIGLDGIGNTFVRLRWSWNRVRAGDGKETLPRSRLVYVLNTRPSRFLSQVTAEGTVGGEVDFDNVRTGRGANLVLGVILRPTNHLELSFNIGRRYLNVDVPDAESRPRLFTAKVDRLRATYNFNARSYVRAIVQYVNTDRDPSLYLEPVEARSADFAGSFLFAYKLNWQTVFFVGYGDDRELLETEDWAKVERQFFVKVSYAFQR